MLYTNLTTAMLLAEAALPVASRPRTLEEQYRLCKKCVSLETPQVAEHLDKVVVKRNLCRDEDSLQKAKDTIQTLCVEKVNDPKLNIQEIGMANAGATVVWTHRSFVNQSKLNSKKVQRQLHVETIDVSANAGHERVWNELYANKISAATMRDEANAPE